DYRLPFVFESVFQDSNSGIEIEPRKKHQRAERNGILHYWLDFSERLGKRRHRERRRQHVVAQKRWVEFELVRVVDNRASGIHLASVPLYGILVERDQHVQPVAVGMHLLFGHSHAQPDMPAANYGLIAIIGTNVEAEPAD